MISSKIIVDTANNVINSSDTNSMVLSQISIIDSALMDSYPSVSSYNDLPDVVNNKGRIIYVKNEGEHYFSNGIFWSKDYSSDEGVMIQEAWAWGSNGNGRLGDGTIVSKSSPVSVVGGITNWAQVSAGDDHSLGVTSTGIAYAWGSNGNGRLGDGTIVSKSSPVSVVGGITNWSQVSAGGYHSLGVTSTGIAYAWGANGEGRLGDGTTVAKSSPVSVIGGITNWVQVSTGFSHSLGVTSTGIAYAWGSNGNGRLGDGTIGSKTSPVSVIGGITNWSQVSAGGYHSLGVTSTGIAYAWGSNGHGQLGDGTTGTKFSPVSVVGGITNWSQVSAGRSHSLGLTSTGIAYAWGANGYGRLGDGTTVSKSSPVSVIGGITNWSQVSAGYRHSLGVTSTGIAYAWGSNGNGRLGDGTTIARTSPVSVVGGIANWFQVSAGGSHSLALQSIAKGF